MKIHLRFKKIKGNRLSLYFDFYPAIFNPETRKYTRREFLGIYVVDNPKNSFEKEAKKDTIKNAQILRAKREIEIQHENFGFLKRKVENVDLLPFFYKVALDYKQSGKGDSNNWMSVYNYLCQFTNGTCKAKNITEEFCNDFKNYVQSVHTFRSTKTQLANNSAVGYFNIFKRMIRLAVKAKLLENDFSSGVKSIRKTETKREYLTYNELKQLAATDCDMPILKRACLFSALTGLRYSDVLKLKWDDVHQDDSGDHLIKFIQKKTKGVETLPISNEAHALLGEKKEPSTRIFEGLLYSSWQNLKIQEWVYRAEIYKKITFHCFRHTYATIQLSLGTDIYTVSKMLGHRDLHTTQIYAKIIDPIKREAANRISLFQ